MKKKSWILSGILTCTLCTTAILPFTTVHAEISQAASVKATTNLSASQLLKQITTGIELPSQRPMNIEMFKDTYKVNRAYLKSYQVNAPIMNVHSNEIAVFQLKNKKYMNKVLPQIEQRLENIQNNAFYPEQVTIARKGKVVTKGNYILLVVDQNVTKIINNFKKFIDS